MNVLFRKIIFIPILLIFFQFGIQFSYADEGNSDGGQAKPSATLEFENGSKLIYQNTENGSNVNVRFVDPTGNSRIILRGKLETATISATLASDLGENKIHVMKKKELAAALIKVAGKYTVIDQYGRTLPIAAEFAAEVVDIKTSHRYVPSKYANDTTEEFLGVMLIKRATGMISKVLSKGTTLVLSRNSQDVYYANGIHSWGEVTTVFDSRMLVPFGKSVELTDFPAETTAALFDIPFRRKGPIVKRIGKAVIDTAKKTKKIWSGDQSNSNAEEKPKPVLTESDYRAVKVQMSKDVVDQEEAIDKLIDLRKQMDRGYSTRSHRVVLLDGTTGSGKTSLGTSYAKHLQSRPDSIFEIDCTKYTDERAIVSALFGSDPGYIDSQKPTPFLEFIRKNKDEAVIVLNEFDKASVAFATKFMEIFDKGIISPSNGKPIALGKVLFVLTSNRNSEKIYPSSILKPLNREELKNRIKNMDEAVIKASYEQHAQNPYDNSKSIPKEVLERLDGAVAVGPPSWEGAVEIVKNEFEIYRQIYKSRTGLELEFDNSVFQRVVDASYVPQYGVRRLKRSFETTFFKILDLIEKDAKEANHIVRFVPAPDSSGGRFLIENSKDITSTELPVAPIKNRKKTSPVHDPSERAILMAMEANISKIVMGQPEAVTAATTSILSKAANPSVKQPGRLLFVGPSGTGKSELALAIAVARYGGENNLRRFVMGDVQSMADLNNIFGSPRSTHGSDSFGPFEQFLINNPNGGVALMDEIGNTVDEHVKDAMRKKFYEILDKGEWTSPSGKTYDVSKFFFLFTSNEGQEIMMELPSDDLRMAAHKKFIDPKKITDYLKQAHRWPEALLNRFGVNVVMARPLVVEHRPAISKKLVLASVNSLADEYEFKLNIEDAFYKKVSEIFYSHTQGARMIRDMANEAVTTLVTKFVFDSSVDASLLANSKLSIDVHDNYDNVRYAERMQNDRVVKLLLTVNLPSGQTKQYDLDATRYAHEKIVSSKQDLRRFAFHEAGHALLSPSAVEHITIQSAGAYGGYVRFAEPKSKIATRSSEIAEIAKMLAGGEAEELAGFEKSNGWRQDLEMARKKAIQMIQNGLVQNATSLPLDEKGKVIITHPISSKLISEVLAEGTAIARAELSQKLPTLYMVASQLLKKQKLQKDEFNDIVASVAKTEKQKQLLRAFGKNKNFQQHVKENACRIFYGKT